MRASVALGEWQNGPRMTGWLRGGAPRRKSRPGTPALLLQHSLRAGCKAAVRGLQSWCGSADCFSEAPWWAGLERLQLGSASGTQA